MIKYYGEEISAWRSGLVSGTRHRAKMFSLFMILVPARTWSDIEFINKFRATKRRLLENFSQVLIKTIQVGMISDWKSSNHFNIKEIHFPTGRRARRSFCSRNIYFYQFSIENTIKMSRCLIKLCVKKWENNIGRLSYEALGNHVPGRKLNLGDYLIFFYWI